MRALRACLIGTSLTALGACTPTTNSDALLDDYKSFLTTDVTQFTSNATISNNMGSADYAGVARINLGLTSEFLGELNATLDFDSATLAGSIDEFSELNRAGTALALGASVSGNLDLDGTLTGNNETLRAGIQGTAIGSIDGQSLSLDMAGNLVDASGSTLVLYFVGPISSGFAGTGWASEQ